MTTPITGSRAPRLRGARTVFTTRHAGQTRADLRGFPGSDSTLVFVRQVHGTTVHTVQEGDLLPDDPTEPVAEADALVTTRGDVTLGVLVADCLPVLLSDPEAGVIGAAHAGRRGLLAGVLERTVEAMESRGATRDRIEAAIGPAICGTCYEVPEAMRTEASARIPALHALTSWGTPALDLRAGAVTVLEGMGVDRARIDAENPCTFEDQDYVSYRRDGRAGHIAGLVMRDTPGASTE